MKSVPILVTFVALLGSSCSKAEQYHHWYGFYSFTLRDIAGSKCYSNYTTGEFPELAKYGVPNGIDVCRAMTTCLLQNLGDMDKADMQSATIVLGLTPTILAYLGPTVGELALLSSRRPVLATLLALGAPAIFAIRPFELYKPGDALTKDSGAFVLHKQSLLKAAVMGAVQYLMITLAAINCLLNSLQLGSSTILSWKCRWSYLELAWNFMPLASHLCAAVSLRYSKVSPP